jgi:hypothetical protein
LSLLAGPEELFEFRFNLVPYSGVRLSFQLLSRLLLLGLGASLLLLRFLLRLWRLLGSDSVHDHAHHGVVRFEQVPWKILTLRVHPVWGQSRRSLLNDLIIVLVPALIVDNK